MSDIEGPQPGVLHPQLAVLWGYAVPTPVYDKVVGLRAEIERLRVEVSDVRLQLKGERVLHRETERKAFLAAAKMAEEYESEDDGRRPLLLYNDACRDIADALRRRAAEGVKSD